MVRQLDPASPSRPSSPPLVDGRIWWDQSRSGSDLARSGGISTNSVARERCQVVGG